MHKYKVKAATYGFLEREDITDAEITEIFQRIQTTPIEKEPSELEPYRNFITNLVAQNVERQAILLRLRENYKYTGSYSSVERFVNKLKRENQEPESFIRVHTEPGEEMQVDFGDAGQIYDIETGMMRRAYVFVATLSYSRHQYAKIVFDQKMPTWLRLHQHAFEFFGGVSRTIVPNNLKAAVKKVLSEDIILSDAYRKMARHYGCRISPTRPATPNQKGKVENGVHYVKRNFLAGQIFENSQTANEHLREWILKTAGLREHGTTREKPLELFTKYEKQALLPLPAEKFDLTDIRTAKVHPDCHIQIDKNYYSVPYQYVGKKVTVFLNDRMIEIYYEGNLVCTHLLAHGKGQWMTDRAHYPEYKTGYLEMTPMYCREKAQKIGPNTEKMADILLSDQETNRLRTVQSILQLAKTVGNERLEAACRRALYYNHCTYHCIKGILNKALDKDPLPEEIIAENPARHLYSRKPQEFFEKESAQL